MEILKAYEEQQVGGGGSGGYSVENLWDFVSETEASLDVVVERMIEVIAAHACF